MYEDHYSGTVKGKYQIYQYEILEIKIEVFLKIKMCKSQIKVNCFLYEVDLFLDFMVFHENTYIAEILKNLRDLQTLQEKF